MAALHRLPALLSQHRNRLAQPSQHLQPSARRRPWPGAAQLALVASRIRLAFPDERARRRLKSGDFADQRTAALLYAGNFLFASAAFCLLWLWASRDRRLIRDEMCDEAIHLRTLRMVIAMPAFAVPFFVAVWSPIAAVAIDGAIMITFLFSDGWMERRMGTLNAALAPRLKDSPP